MRFLCDLKKIELEFDTVDQSKKGKFVGQIYNFK